MSEDLDLHNDSAMIRNRGPYRDFVIVLIFCLGHVECGEDRRGDNEDYSIGKVTPRTDPLASTKR